ncbi:MAG TPA: hypothetical protein VF853_01335 [Candidatus Deferrimicrobiaceae bacterium]
MRGRHALWIVAQFLLALAVAGCAPSRMVLTGPEGGRAEAFFAVQSTAVDFPVKASFSGVLVPFLRDVVPFVAGVSALSAAEETVGLYDPMGRGVLFLANDGRCVEVSRGPAADLVGFRGASPLASGDLSIARVLSGVPGYPVSGGEAARNPDGGWSLSDGRQTLTSDPGRRFLVRASYRLPGMTVEVSYPDRDSAGPPPRLALSIRGARILLRRDEE